MPILEDITSGIDTNSPENPSAPLGTLSSGATLLMKALKSIPELSEAMGMLGEMSDQPGEVGGKTYNGTVDVLGTPVEITNGIGDIEGNKIYVAPDGGIVADETGKIMGRIENGKFVVIDQAQASKLEQSKMAERSKQ